MFTYCLNNPVNMLDTAGNFPWHIVVGAVIGAVVEAFVTLINGGTAGEVILSALEGAVVGAVVAAYPSVGIILAVYEIAEEFINCLYDGLSPGQTIAVVGTSIASHCVLPSTGDDMLDLVIDSTFGVSKEFLSEGGKILATSNQPEKPDEKAVTHAIFSVLATGIGGGGGGTYTSICFDLDRRLGL